MLKRHIWNALPILILMGGGLPGRARAQCLLANPSFEIAGSADAAFAGWNSMGVVDSIAEPVHGARAARVVGLSDGTWSLSGLWQSLDCQPGERWRAVGHSRPSALHPLVGACQALVNVEWRNAAGGLISYDSVPIADSSSATDEYLVFSVLSSPAPAGTSSARLVLGLLQEPNQPAAAVCFDHVTFDDSTPPTVDEVQWNDFPGGRSLVFADRTWRVKGPGWYGPGPNCFSDQPEAVWVDNDDRLHLTIRQTGSGWCSSEVALEEVLGYGDYIFSTRGSLDQLDIHTVLGLFLWQYSVCYDAADSWWNPANEIDVEFSRWGNAANGIGQFVAQPWDWSGNLVRFDATFGEMELSSHAFRWLPDRVEFRSWRGGPDDETPESLIHQWVYSGPHLPRPEQPRVHLNLWQAGGPPAAEQEVILDAFTFVPMDESTDVPPATRRPVSADRPLLQPPAPNPFNPSTWIHYDLPENGAVEIAVFDLGGARVRTLMRGSQSAGTHEVQWDGRDDSGKPLASGFYFCMLQQGSRRDTQRLLLLR